MKALILLALCLSLTLSIETLIMSIALPNTDAYKSRFAVNVGTPGTHTITMTFPTNTGNAPATFTIRVILDSGPTDVLTATTKTVDYTNTVTQTWSSGTTTGPHTIEIIRTSSFNELTL